MYKLFSVLSIFFCLAAFGNVRHFGTPIEPFPTNKDENGVQTAILSVQRSGVHWLGYCINQLTSRFVVSVDSKAYNKLETNFTRKKLPIYTHHIHKRVASFKNLEKQKIIFLVRNYKETLIRNFGRMDKIRHVLNHSETEPSKIVVPHLELYDKHPKENRCLVYYEDLLLNPKKTLLNVLEFLGEPSDRLEKFISNLEVHKQYVISLYNSKFHGPSKSGGADLLYHSKKFDRKDLTEIDNIIKNLNPEIFEKYLKRFIL